MTYDARFGSTAQTPAQRARVLEQLQAALPGLKTKATTHARQLYARYVAGELTWADVRQALNAATQRLKDAEFEQSMTPRPGLVPSSLCETSTIA